MAIEIDPTGVMARAILNATDFRGANVLEVGAGDGRLTYQYAAQPSSIVAIDTKESDILSAKQDPRAESYRHAHFLCASATDLPFAAEQFGIVLLASSL
jgi:ubiquinone/menaquinone biosynthesis C-methylase UbiE